jgi:hypothetical protein
MSGSRRNFLIHVIKEIITGKRDHQGDSIVWFLNLSDLETIIYPYGIAKFAGHNPVSVIHFF